MKLQMSKAISLLLFLLFLAGTNFAQIDKKERDRLLREMSFGKTDTAKVFAHYSYGDLWVNINNDSAYHYYNKGKQLAIKVKNPYLEAVSHGYLIVLLNNEGKYKEALELCQNAEKLFIEAKASPRNFVIVYINSGNEWQYLGAFNNAAQNYFKALKLAAQINDCIFQSVCLNNLSSLYLEMLDSKNHLIYAEKAKAKAIECNDDYRIFSSSINLVGAYVANNKFEDAKTEIGNLEKIKTKLSDPEFDLDVAIAKADYYQKIKNDASAIENYLFVLEKCKNYNNKEYELSAAKQLALIYFKNNQFEESKKFANKALVLSTETEARNEKAEIIKLFADIAEKKGNFGESLQYRKEWELIKDTIALVASKNVVIKLEMEYQNEQKELRIIALSQLNEIQDLKIKRRLWTTITLFFAFLGMAVFAFTQFKNFKTKKALLIAQQDNAIAEERLRIASDMHDDVGSGLSRIRYIIGAVLNGQTEQNQGLTKITGITDDSIQKMKEIIWSLNESNQNLEDLIYYIRGQMSKMADDANVSFECRLPENIPTVFFGWKRNRNTYLLVKEVVNNALKHAHANTITLHFEVSDNFRITISDDGVGFDTTKSFTGNGLNNYKKRMSELDARYTLVSEIGKGTTFDVLFQLNV